ncbi:intercellular adhesion molecule 2-like isoform X2 [Nelusetta ayraudi]|uniref:intercellular adhesion molecule 2-like isoform X2 n=1 Tax=Nelusetta ayraudi TaxID=303726 RepID=UPI003F724621
MHFFHLLNVGHSAEMMVLLLLICDRTATAEEACPIQTNPTRAIVRYGNPFTANCSLLSDQVEGMGWESNSGGVPLKLGVRFLLLTIPKVKEWKFDPVCFISNTDGEQCQRMLNITVYKPPDSVSISDANPRVPVVEGENYDVKCDVTNVAPVRNLLVSWHKGNKVFSTQTFDDSTVYPVTKSTVISVVADRNDTGTEIWCEAKLVFEPTAPILPSSRSNSVKVQVLYPPTFASPAEEELELSANFNMTLNCTATGNPPPVYSWKFPHEIQQTTEDKHMNQPVVTPSYQLEGTYICTASNSQGKVVKTFKVTEKPRSRPGTTAAILVAVFFLLITIMACVVYRKQRNSSADRP